MPSSPSSATASAGGGAKSSREQEQQQRQRRQAQTIRKRVAELEAEQRRQLQAVKTLQAQIRRDQQQLSRLETQNMRQDLKRINRFVPSAQHAKAWQRMSQRRADLLLKVATGVQQQGVLREYEAQMLRFLQTHPNESMKPTSRK